MALFGKKKPSRPPLDREESLAAKPVLNRLVRTERDEEGHVILHVPRRQTGLVKAVSKWFRVPPYKRIALDELGTFAIELCDGEHAVSEIVDRFAREFRLNRREAKVSMATFLRTLAERGIIGLVIEEAED